MLWNILLPFHLSFASKKNRATSRLPKKNESSQKVIIMIIKFFVSEIFLCQLRILRSKFRSTSWTSVNEECLMWSKRQMYSFFFSVFWNLMCELFRFGTMRLSKWGKSCFLQKKQKSFLGLKQVSWAHGD